MCVVSLSLIVMILGIIAYSENIKSIGIVENVKSALGEITQSTNTVTQSDVTTVDVTGIELGKETQHEHIYKTVYDETKHWEECKSCGEKRNEIMHSFTTTWALGSESCHRDNSYTKTCLCGYSENGHKPCVWDGVSYITPEKYHQKCCTICKNVIEHSYYLYSYGNGNLYNLVDTIKYPLDNYPYAEFCHLSNGNKLSCTGNSVCSTCKVKSTANVHFLDVNDTDIVYCEICKKSFGTCSNQVTIDNSVTPPIYTIVSSCNLTNGLYLADTNNLGVVDTSIFQLVSQSLTNFSDWSNFVITTKIQLKNTIKEPIVSWLYIRTQTNGVLNSISNEYTLFPDKVNPTISNISVGNVNSWSKSRRIVISGTENYCDNITIQILDDIGNLVYTGSTNVDWTNYTSSRQYGDYSVSCTPELEADFNGKKFKFIVTDSCGNSIEKDFTISKIDGIAPEVTSESVIGGEWAKSKDFTFSAIDNGIGNVQIAFNDVSDYKLANKSDNVYSRDYKFVGDVYFPTDANVYYKDELENVVTQKVTLDKIDNTAPTIVKANVHNNILTVESHDRHATLGEGSGVAKYKYLASKERLESPNVNDLDYVEIDKNEKIVVDNISEIKYVYIVAEDLVRKCE